MSAPVVFLDLETTGLDPSRHQLYEIGLIEASGVEHAWWVKPGLETADSTALRIGRYYERIPAKVDNAAKVAKEVAQLTAGKHLVGAVPSFDEGFLAPWLRRNGQAPSWHYHLICVEALAAGKLGFSPPWNSSDLTAALDVTVPEGDKHTALGDARWAKAIYDAVMAASVSELEQVYHAALGRILNLAQEDEAGDMIGPILETVRTAMAGKTFEQAQEERRRERMAGIDLSGRPA